MRWTALSYALLCVLTPMVWGLLVVWISSAIERKVRAARKDGVDQEISPIDYHI